MTPGYIIYSVMLKELLPDTKDQEITDRWNQESDDNKKVLEKAARAVISDHDNNFNYGDYL